MALLVPVTILASFSNASDSTYSIHGYASQAYIFSSENNFYGKSNGGGGSWEYYEAAVGGQYRANNLLSFSGQLFARDAGKSDDGSIRTDYLYANLNFFQSLRSGASLRLGRVRNPYGFYNSTRDVFFTRPSIVLPQLYYEGLGIRELFFSSDGLQLDSYWESENQSSRFISTFGRTDDISSDTFDNILGGQPGFSGNSEIRKPVFAQLSSDFWGGRWRTAISYFDAVLTLNNASTLAELDANIIAISAQHNREKLTFTTEYSQLSTDMLFVVPQFGVARTSGNKGESIYLQMDYRQTPSVTWYTRLDHQIQDRTQPNETDSTILTFGGKWAPDAHWQFAAELHGIRGTTPVPAVDNQLTQINERSEMFVMMAGYRF